MIVDLMKNERRYPFGPIWQQAMSFLSSLKPDAEPKRYDIQGQDLYAMISRYETVPEPDRFESHARYADIHTVLSGSESLAWIPVEGLEVETAYDETKDVGFYRLPAAPLTRVALQPGTFMMLFPGDAHITRLLTGSAPEEVVKVVIKINALQLRPYVR